MIQDVANFFEKQITGSSEVRNFSYDMFVHRIRIKNNTVQNIMAKDVFEICDKINKQTFVDGVQKDMINRGILKT